MTYFCFIYQAVLSCGQKFIDEGHSSSDEIKARCDQLQENWDELNSLAKQRSELLSSCLLLLPVTFFSVLMSQDTQDLHC